MLDFQDYTVKDFHRKSFTSFTGLFTSDDPPLP